MTSIRGARKSLVGLILLLAATLVLGACGGGGVESDEVAAVVQQAVAAAVAAAGTDAASAGPSAAEISAMVQEAVESAAPEGVTAADIGTFVEAAVAAAAQPAVSAAEIEALVTQAVEQAAAEAAAPLSASEVESIVAAAVAAIPVPEPVVIAMPTAAPAMEMDVVVVGGTHRAYHEVDWGGLEVTDPISATGWQPLVYMLWDRLAETDLETGRMNPALATSWESNGDGTQWTFNLRQGVTFSDGTPFTAADVIYTTRRHLDPEIGSQMLVPMSIIDQDALEMPDDHTVVFNLTSANVDFPVLAGSEFILIIPDGSGDSHRENPIGTGAVTVQSAVFDGVTVLDARDDYWAGSPLLGKITVVGIAAHDARLSAALAGQIDMVGVKGGISAAESSLFQGDPDFYIQETPKGNIQAMAMIVSEPPFDDLRVRQALKLVIDPEEMIAVAAQGHGVPACNSPGWPGDQYYLPLECPQDIERAIALLAEAGYPDGLTVELITSNLNPLWEAVATVYKEQAALAGINVELNLVPSDGYWGNIWMVEPFVQTYWFPNPLDNFLSVAFRCGAAWNETFWCSEEQDILQDQARAESDFDTRKALYQEIQRIIAEEGGMIAPFIPNNIRAVNTRLQGVPTTAQHYELPFHELRIIEP